MELRPADIAKECGVSVGTVRNWCTDYAEFLSAGANPNDGNRHLSERDLEICRYIANLRKEGMSKPQVILRLRETTFGHVDAEQPIVKATADLQSPQESHHDTPAVIVALDDLERRIDAKIEALRLSATDARQSQRDYVQGIAVGAIGALVFVVFLLLLFLVRHYL